MGRSNSSGRAERRVASRRQGETKNLNTAPILDSSNSNRIVKVKHALAPGVWRWLLWTVTERNRYGA
jgi:hypothetical protein